MRRALILITLVGSCGTGGHAAAPRPIVSAPAAPAAPAPDAAPGRAPAQEQLAWVTSALAEPDKVTSADITAHFAASFLAAVPEAQLRAGFQQLHGIAITEPTLDPSGTKLEAHATLQGHKLRIGLVVDADHKITGLVFRPDLGDKPASWDAIDTQLKAAAPHVQLLASEKCNPLHAVNQPRDELAIGSTFKLYVLLAVVDQIKRGKLTWDTPVAVRDDWKSLPSGTTQNETAGTKLTVRELANRMISISDNTATDHLLYTVGRRSLEIALLDGHHGDAPRDIPFLSTREMFLLKLGDPKDLDRYLAMDASHRRTYLDKTLAGKHPTLASAESWKTARHIDKLEWFASSDDLCRVMTTLQDRAQDPKLAPLLDVLAINPGVPLDKSTWAYVGYKGGSEPGVINLTWLLRRKDNRWFVLTLTANSDEGGSVPEDQLVAIASGAIDLLAAATP